MTVSKWFQISIGVAITAPIGAISFGISGLPAPAQEAVQETVQNTTFACQMDEDIPVTVAQTPVATVQIVRWDAAAIAIEATPQADCETSADQFQASYEDDLLSYITTGRMEGQLVACAADKVSGRCLSRLLSLQQTQRPRIALQQVLQIRLPTEGPISDTGPRPYVELDRYLNGGYTRITHR